MTEPSAAVLSMSGLSAVEAGRLLDAVPHRRARRSFDGTPVAEADLDALEELGERWRPSSQARAVVVRHAPSALFLGVIGSYGGVSHAPSAIAFIGGERHHPEEVGYTGEALVLAATALGLGTCWVAGIFNPAVVRRLVAHNAGERVLAVSALGHALATPSRKERLLFSAGHDKMRRSLDEIAPGHDGWPRWARDAVSAARIAPSAMNAQPWRFAFASNSLTVSYHGVERPRSPKRLDCGIAMLHAELGALGAGVSGTWELLESPGVARFTPSAG